MRVVLVEDSAAFRLQIKQVLRPLAGTQVVMEGGSAAQSRDWLRLHPGGWDLALVDMFLADGNGFEVLRTCAPRSSRQKVAMMSNYTRETVREHVLRAGADAFFDKSMELEHLIDFCARHAHAVASRGDGHAASNR